MSEPLITKYRPQTLEEVLGNAPVLKSLRESIEGDTCPHSYLLTGPSGVGKTTIARIIAIMKKAMVEELDAASNGSVDDTRRLVDMAGYRPLNGQSKMIIIDEAHNLSSKAFEPLLKIIEEPPPWLYFALCTTEPQKIKETIKTRCHPVKLSALKPQEIEDLLILISDLEGWTVTGSTFQAIVQAATGQPRKALSILQAGHACVDRDELSAIIAEVESSSEPLIELLKYMMGNGREWERISRMLQKIENEDNLDEQAIGYLTKSMERSGEGQANAIWNIIEYLIQPKAGYNKKANLIAAVGGYLWGKQVF